MVPDTHTTPPPPPPPAPPSARSGGGRQRARQRRPPWRPWLVPARRHGGGGGGRLGAMPARPKLARPASSPAPSPVARHCGPPRAPPRELGRGGPPRAQPRESSRRTPSSLPLLQIPALAAEVGRVDLLRAPWTTATTSATCHDGPPRPPPVGSTRSHHRGARGGVQQRWYPAHAVPRTPERRLAGRPVPPASMARSASSAAGIHSHHLAYSC
ncbi:hypothetical protein PVAP13_2NG462700 [Panicum virgatum]|uniref:Uncharacterized protein n=1 Tax=Panicum virgatum TaxID=38727 RepID=A0A8T0VIL3_PANVG|nr:hypothetical protein PVAP13_2NG462700 [Panicum virgatum]